MCIFRLYKCVSTWCLFRHKAICMCMHVAQVHNSGKDKIDQVSTPILSKKDRAQGPRESSSCDYLDGTADPGPRCERVACVRPSTQEHRRCLRAQPCAPPHCSTPLTLSVGALREPCGSPHSAGAPRRFLPTEVRVLVFNRSSAVPYGVLA